MADYVLSEAARVDADNIYVHSIITFGLSTARAYLEGLHVRLQQIADHAVLGRDYSHVLPGLLRYEHRSHSVYFQRTPEGILVFRILGAGQDPVLHIVADNDT